MNPPRFVVRGVLRLRRGLHALADRIVPAQFALFELTTGTWRTQILGALAELGVPDALARRPATAAELAPRVDADPDTLHRVLRAAAVFGVVTLDPRGRFALTRLGEALRGDGGAWARYLALPSTSGAWTGLAQSLRDGRPAFPRANGDSVWEHFATHPEEEALFATSMRQITEIDLPAIVGGYPWPHSGTVADVAGGVGTVLAAVLNAQPGLRGVLVDAPGVLAQADAHLRAAGVRERVELVEGDIFAEVRARADVYVLKDVLHDWGDAKCHEILATVRATMPAGARLVLVERLQERHVPDPINSLTDIQMLTQCDDGRQRSAAELASLLRGAGLFPGRVRLTAGPALVEARASP